MASKTTPKYELAVIAFACVLPTLVTLAYFVGAAESAAGVQQLVYGAAKLIQFALPVVWVAAACREHLAWPRWNRHGLLLGAAFGLLVSAALGCLYVWLSGTEVLIQALGPIREKVASLGVATPARFVALGVFYAVVHSLLEEYYWRWFVYGRLRQHIAVGWAIALSALAFAGHHVIVLWTYFAHAPSIALLLAGCVAVGGAYWAWLYQRSQSIYAVWLSHLIVDAAIFAVGYVAVRSVLDT
jgi:membrane protease YdiL (CAAX protease family)